MPPRDTAVLLELHDLVRDRIRRAEPHRHAELRADAQASGRRATRIANRARAVDHGMQRRIGEDIEDLLGRCGDDTFDGDGFRGVGHGARGYLRGCGSHRGPRPHRVPARTDAGVDLQGHRRSAGGRRDPRSSRRRSSATLAARAGSASLPDVGDSTARSSTEALAGGTPAYLERARGRRGRPDSRPGAACVPRCAATCTRTPTGPTAARRIETMIRAATELGHDYVALTDHSPRLKVAHGLTAERLREQLDVVAALNEELAPFRILTGDRGRHPRGRLARPGRRAARRARRRRRERALEAAHGRSQPMTDRMVAAVANPHVDVLGHCTGRLVLGRGRPESTFDAELVFTACREFDTAVEINSRPERLDPPDAAALPRGRRRACCSRIDSDAHAPGQLAWQPYGCERSRRGRRAGRPHRQHVGRRRSPRLDRGAPATTAVCAVRCPVRGTDCTDAAVRASSQTTAPSCGARASRPSTRSPSHVSRGRERG